MYDSPSEGAATMQAASTKYAGHAEPARDRPPLEAMLDDIENSLRRTANNVRATGERAEIAGRTLRCEPVPPSSTGGVNTVQGVMPQQTGLARLKTLVGMAESLADHSDGVLGSVEETLRLVA